MELIKKYFPGLSDQQMEQFAMLPALYEEWNAKINVISRQDLENLEERHLLHSLSIAKFIEFKDGAKILDLGTGGGMPGIPLAILFPHCEFVLVDGTGKKITVVRAIVEALDLQNVTALHCRAEELRMLAQFDFVVSRGVAPLNQLLQWSQKLVSKTHQHGYPNGIIALKGGKLRNEIAALPGKGKDYTDIFQLSKLYKTEFFEEKCIVYVQA